MSVEATFEIIMPSANAPRRTGYTFVGYYDFCDVQYYNSNMNSVKSYSFDENLILIAKWSLNSYAVTCEYLDDNGIVEPVVTDVNYKSSFNLGVPTEYGNIFNGWYLEENRITDSDGHCLQDWNFTENKTLVASWTEIITEGLTYYDCSATEVFVNSYSGSDRLVVVPEKYMGKIVVGISELAFFANPHIRELFLPKNIRSIGIAAFIGCDSLNQFIFLIVS